MTLTLAAGEVRNLGITGVGLRLGARASRPQSRAGARRTLILAFSRKGRRDPLTAICTWFRMAGLIATLWIPAFAGMTVKKSAAMAR